MGRYLAKKRMRAAEQQDLETDAGLLPEQEELIRSATETIGQCRTDLGAAGFGLC